MYLLPPLLPPLKLNRVLTDACFLLPPLKPMQVLSDNWQLTMSPNRCLYIRNFDNSELF